MTHPTANPLRWKYRFDNFQRAFLLLREGVETLVERPLSQLEKEGLIQRFEYTWELAWKTLGRKARVPIPRPNSEAQRSS